MKYICKSARAVIFFAGIFIAIGRAASNECGADMVSAFSRAAQGEPLRYVVMGGSITQAGEGWVGGWLKEQFPKSLVSIINAGISGTNSRFGVFRLERDVIAFQPDIVGIEYCVNDGGAEDGEVIQAMESLVVRLKQLPNPPAIFIIEAASKTGVNLSRHRQVARHYGLLEVDMQEAVDRRLKNDPNGWSSLFGDGVHPNKEGNAFYASVIEEKFKPLVALAKNNHSQEPLSIALPPPLSTKPLVLDARMAALSSTVSEWNREYSVPGWWGRIFLGALGADNPESVLVYPFRGTEVGLFYPMDPGFGSFYASVDGREPQQFFANLRSGFGFTSIARDLPAREHVLTIALPPKAPEGRYLHAQNGPVKLGYVLIAGESLATREKSPQGAYTLEKLRHYQTAMGYIPIPADQWKWAGVYPVKKVFENDADADMETAYPPENDGADGMEWKDIPHQENLWIDFRKLTGSKAPGIVYATTDMVQPEDRAATLIVDVDYYTKIWVNGKQVSAITGMHSTPILVRVVLERGHNKILVKLGSGSLGFGFCVMVKNDAPAKP